MICKAKRAFPTSNKGQTFPVEILTAEEVGLLMSGCSKRAPTGIRNRALLAVLYRAGLRIAEALALKPKDVDHDAGTITVLHGKGGKRRVVGIDDGALALVELWLAKRKDLGFNGRHAVFCTLDGKQVSDAYCRIWLTRIGRKVGIEKRVHPHAFRHTMASDMRREGIDIGVISKQLGHASIATTARYLDHVCPAAVVDAVRAREWSTESL